MNYSVSLQGRQVQVELSRCAENALNTRNQPLVAVVHLIFGCMVAKRVWFKESVEDEVAKVNDKLNLTFNAVRYAVCSLELIDGGAEPEDFPMVIEKSRFVPDVVRIDYSNKKFLGEFTYQRSKAREEAAAANLVLEAL
ncbi:hypothetical protein MNBD_GAMMA15-2469 [hydrothermal vent metagenome]|uniref:Uncharacterized protein n=1 Tax=hydrothermal vent metagenome TaxID=652676 RepID=A0A3B0YGA9_9ZZZZ